MREFVLTQPCSISLELNVRCQSWSLVRDDSDGDVTQEDLAFWERIVAVLNANSQLILQDTEDGEA